MENREKSIGRWISILYRNGNSFLDRELKDHNIGSGQFMFIAVLLHNEGLTQEGLSDFLQIDKATTARALNKLEENGYIERLADPKDRRVNIIRLTKKGQSLKPVIFAIADKWTELLTNGFTEKEKMAVIDLLKRMALNSANLQVK